ncbi:MAG: aconitate hydratase AcnA [Woeseiaceae bacterium]|nr:aconitate hydratase AcnA [Woeseiaceae bacterium]
MTDSFGARSTLSVGENDYEIYRLDAVKDGHVDRLPYSLKILLENLLRHEDGRDVTRDDILALANWDPTAAPSTEISFTPARVVLQDFTGVPAVVDLAAMRDAVVKLGGSADDINPLSPAELVIDHSVQIDHYGAANALDLNTKIEFQRNKERYQFLKWGQQAFDNFKVVPPNTGIVHQVNLEYLARVIFGAEKDGVRRAYPDTVVGTDSHTTMINGLGVLGWGVGGIEAEAAMLGQPITMLIPHVIGFKLTGKLKEGTTATDLVLTCTEMLRDKGVVGKFVEFFGDGLAEMPLADRATLGNMAPEFGSTCGIFPIDGETIRYMKLSGRDETQCELVEAYARTQGLWREDGQADALYTDVLELDLGDVEPSIAGPKRPQDRIALSTAASSYKKILADTITGREDGGSGVASLDGDDVEISDGSILIASITSCTNTSNPAVMVAAGLLARNAAAKGLTSKPWVKTSLAPGSRVVSDYLEKAELIDDLEAVGFYTVGYGCTTCIGNSGPLKPEIADVVTGNNVVGVSVLSGNRNFEGRIHPLVQHNFLASPPLVVAYALAGRMDVDLYNDPLGQDADGNDVFMRDIWPSQQEIYDVVGANIDSAMFQASYGKVFDGDENWRRIDSSTGDIYGWEDDSTYVRNPPYFEGMTSEADPVTDIKGARVLALLGDSVTTDHISPAGSIAKDSPAAAYLESNDVKPADFNSYGSRRGNHEVMMRGTFANIRLRNRLAPGTEGGWTRHQPSGEQMSIYDASVRYKAEGTPLVVLAGTEYGTGSSRDWAAKGTLLLGVKAVIAKSFERIHRSNLIGMGVLPLQFVDGEDAESLGLTGTETFDVTGQTNPDAKRVTVTATAEGGDVTTFEAQVRIDTPKERDYYENGGILHYVLRQLAA